MDMEAFEAPVSHESGPAAPVAAPTGAPSPRWPSRLARWLAFLIPRVVGLVFLWAGVQKLTDPSRIIRVLEFDGLTQTIGSLRFAVIGAYAVAIGEVTLGALLCIGLWKRRVAMAAIIVLLVFSVQLAYLIVSQYPDCACITIWEKYRDARHNMTMGMIRNALMAVALEWTRQRTMKDARRSDVDGGGVGAEANGPAPGTG